MPLPLPLPLPVVSRGFSMLTRRSRERGVDAALTASSVLSDLMGMNVVISGTPVPCPAGSARGLTSVVVTLEGLPATGSIEIETSLVASVLSTLAGRDPAAPAALTPIDLERPVLELCTLLALDALPEEMLEELRPRLSTTTPTPGGLVVALDVRVGPHRGGGRVVVPAAAVALLGHPPAPFGRPRAEGQVIASLRHGTITLCKEDLAALSCGDVLLLDDERGQELVFPGGLTARGELEDLHFLVEEVHMTEAQAAYPLTISVEIARVTVTLGELSRMEPGAALALDARKDGHVVLRAGEGAIARGELVEIDGALGVRIVELGGLP